MSVCPILILANPTKVYECPEMKCLNKKCAWWSELREECAIKSIPYFLDQIASRVDRS